MKAIIASDIHGSLKYTKKLEELIKQENPEKLILLGDLYYHGPRNALPEEYNCMGVANILNQYKEKIIAVRGNCDAEVDQMISDFEIMADYQEISLDKHKFYLTHGHLLEKYPEFQENLCLVGHTHVYNLEGNKINPGSIGIPKQHTEHTCILYENDTLYLIDIETLTKIAKRKLDE